MQGINLEKNSNLLAAETQLVIPRNPEWNVYYYNGHMRKDVVAYRCEFVEQWRTYKKHFHQWNNDGHELPCPNGFPVLNGLLFQLVFITHDESIFYQNDSHKTTWAQKTSQPVPQPKGNGQTIMVSDFLTYKWGPLHNDHKFIHHHFPSFLLLTCL